jgi:nitrite reductase/ring-hydroxylating ferredoxin subunit
MHDEVTICRSDALPDSSVGARTGVRFPAMYMGSDVTLFFIRYEGRVHGYLNRCAHAEIELDETPGQFFDRAGEFLICSSHGALYAPENGRCVAGPCRGARLRAVVVVERTVSPDVSMVYWLPDDAIRPVAV